MPEVFTVETRGTGKPDYSREVSSSKQRAGYALKYGESLKYLVITEGNGDTRQNQGKAVSMVLWTHDALKRPGQVLSLIHI